MKKIEKNIVSSKVFYELSEEELDEMKAESRAAGRKDIMVQLSRHKFNLFIMNRYM